MKVQNKLLYLTCTILFFKLSVNAQVDGNFWDNQKKAFAAVSIEECQSSLKFCESVLQTAPNHPLINYLAARLNEQLGDRISAVKYLKRSSKLGYTSRIKSRWYVNPLNDPVFSNLRNSAEYSEVRKIMKRTDEVIHKSELAFTVDDKRLNYYEGITYDPIEKVFYLGSDNNIFKVDHSGQAEIFTGDAEADGLNWVNGVHVDPVRRTLWACSNDDSSENVDIFKYDLSTGKLVKKYSSPDNGNEHFFNDLVIHPEGDIYISGTTIYKISKESDELEIFVKDKLLSSNGITLSGDGKTLYFASDSFGTIGTLDLKTKAVSKLNHPDDFNTYGIDGLYFSDGYLYAIHNTLLPQVNRFKLSENGSQILSCEYFEKNAPVYGSPTTGVFVESNFYFLAGYNYSGILIMKMELSKD